MSLLILVLSLTSYTLVTATTMLNLSIKPSVKVLLWSLTILSVTSAAVGMLGVMYNV